MQLEKCSNSFIIKNPIIIYENKKIKLDQTKENLNRILKQKIENNKTKLNNIKNNYILNNPKALYKEKQIKFKNLIEKLELVNPLGILKRGYSLTSQNKKIITSIKQIDKAKQLTIKLQDGEINAEIKNIKENKNERN